MRRIVSNGCAGRTRLAVALAGEFPFSGSLDQLLEHAGKISAHKSIRYWSTTDKAWRNLVSDAGVVDGPQGRTVQPDPTVADLVAGRSIYYFEVGRSGRAIHRLTVLERTADRFVLASENVTPIRGILTTAFEPGALQSVTFVDRRGPATWGYYQVIRATEGASSMALGAELFLRQSAGRALPRYGGHTDRQRAAGGALNGLLSLALPESSRSSAVRPRQMRLFTVPTAIPAWLAICS